MQALFLHGVPTDHQLWTPVRQRLGVPSCAPDLPGYGAAPPLSCPSVDAHIQWLEQRIPDPRDLHLVGQDFGGLLAAEWAARRGARSVTLTSSPAGLLWLWPRVVALPGLRAMFYERHGGRLYLRRGGDPALHAQFLPLFLPGVQRPWLADYMCHTAQEIRLRSLASLSVRLRRRRTPVLCLWGDRDPFHPPVVARWTARQLGAALVWVEGGRHFAPFDRPQAYADALRRFWVRTG